MIWKGGKLARVRPHFWNLLALLVIYRNVVRLVSLVYLGVQVLRMKYRGRITRQLDLSKIPFIRTPINGR